MTRKLTSIVLLLLIVPFGCDLPGVSQFPNTSMDEEPDPTTMVKIWESTAGRMSNVVNHRIVKANFGGFYVYGLGSLPDNPFSFEPIVYKLDDNGNVEWDMKFPELVYINDQNTPNAIISSPDGGCLLVLVASSLYPHKNKIVRLDRFGNIQWEKQFDFEGKIWSLDWRADGSFLATGFIGESDGSGSAWIGNYTAEGAQLWTKIVDGGSNFYGSHIVSTTDGGYLLVAPSYIRLIHIYKFDAQNGKEWSRTSNRGDVKSVLQTNDGNFLFLHSRPGYYEYNDIRKLSRATGELMFTTFNSTPKTKDEHVHAIAEMPNGNIVGVGDATGNVVGYTGGQFDSWVIEYEPDGKYIQQVCFGGKGEDSARSVVAVSNDELLFTGIKNLGEEGVWTVKFALD